MKKIFLASLMAFIGLAFYSCVKVRQGNIDYFENHVAGNNIKDVVVNEYSATGSTYPDSLFGAPGDWVEIYNTTDSAIDFSRTNYFITDDSTNLQKFTINKLVIGPKKFMVVQCDTLNVIYAAFPKVLP